MDGLELIQKFRLVDFVGSTEQDEGTGIIRHCANVLFTSLADPTMAPTYVFLGVTLIKPSTLLGGQRTTFNKS